VIFFCSRIIASSFLIEFTVGCIAITAGDSPPPGPPGPVSTDPPPPPPFEGGITTLPLLDVMLVAQKLLPRVLVTASVYVVRILAGGTITSEPVDPRMILPGLRVPVEAPDIDQESTDPLPSVTADGEAVIVQVGGAVTGGITTTGDAVTEATQVNEPAVLIVVIEYMVVALIGGMTLRVPDAPIEILPGLRVPVRELRRVQLRRVPLPLTTFIGLADITQLGTTSTVLLERRAKNEK
jgi:hypothetical protein